MNGYRSLLELRMRGRRPAAVFVTVLDHPADRGAWTNAERALENGMHPQIDIEPGDDIDGLDLRFLRGLVVHLAGTDQYRLMTVLDRLTEFEPARIIATRASGPAGIVTWTPESGLVEDLLETA